ncbi:Bug family tripartite tricarboxylate transporter substrate binding protein [Mesorhizobium sp. ZC-5]|uniref:Bug family tripartite tricarboxylate transporter substrate binding protein n=1 Tax=Mesorhizobium sp. ZC-5 TaxID=2986066 RepID=UPI0021E86D09|nr:tripartite tricarboxylate transporter substrate binding protein [Mesorhizobium sp. ZC-5]MCV3243138.1 tripartite tricarboxylate transporter substrate binding protein [Mesorhizobium sp. ZC-5]
MNFLKRTMVALAATMTIGAAHAQDAANFPDHPLRLVVPFGAGGGSDTLARTLAGSASPYLGQPISIDMQPGASGVIGTTEFVRSAKPDGYDLIITGTGATTTIPHSQKLTYDPLNDFEFVIGVVGLTEVLAVRKDFPAKDAKEFIEYIKANPGKVSLGHSGTGGEDWALIRLLANATESDLTDVPFDGGGPAATAAAGGHIDGVISSLVAVTPFMESGDLRVLAVIATTPSDALPDVPTMPSLGYKDVVLDSRLGIAAPKGTPKEIVQKLHDAFKKTMEDPSFLSFAKRLNMNLQYVGLEDYKKALQGDFDRIGTVYEKTK